jgi:hypothetical protein
MLFAAAAVLGGVILIAASAKPDELINSTTFRLARSFSYIFVNVYAMKMAGVFMISTSTVITYTRIVPRWTAVVGFVLALILLVGSYWIGWSFVLFPIWVLILSICILSEKLGWE